MFYSLRLSILTEEAMDEGLKVRGKPADIISRHAMQDDGGQGGPMLWIGPEVLKLHRLQFLSHSIIVGLRLLEDLAPGGLLSGGEETIQEEVAALHDESDPDEEGHKHPDAQSEARNSIKQFPTPC